MLLGKRVVSVDPAAQAVTTDGGETSGYGTLVWPTGGGPRILAYLQAHLGEVVSGEELRAAGGFIGEWARRVRELDVEQGYEPLADDVMIFDHENANGFFGCHYDSDPFVVSSGFIFSTIASLGVVKWRRTVVPVPISLVTSRVPPMRSARRSWPTTPRCCTPA